MKKIIAIAAVALFTGCTSQNYSDVSDSEAVINNLKVSEVGLPRTEEHQLHVKFDYTIKNYKALDGLYICSVLFATGKSELVTQIKENAPCQIDSKNGSVSMKWITPLSTRAGYSRKALKKMQLPLKYRVAIHQKKTESKNIVIGMSEPLYLAPKL
ncbi:hypothetical protein [Idiomarina seosinensis]|uniref:Uncharacterized protein n=1 Tax=Idiomarina seosinensis TaxID=281739 RepID=A0A432ZGD5_9GAMM|nr:hypothetical protein [Idiomarina seosinensis]RUO77001.1 hypothetical protein CWI81_00390 [Idiomarina seosinensis]